MTDEATVLSTYHAIREALYSPHLSRALDKRAYQEGNPRAGILSLLHGDEHRERRRFENPLFRRDALVSYEQEFFPEILEDVLDRGAREPSDLFDLAGALSVVLAARRAGVDHDGSLAQLRQLFDYVKVIAQASAIFDVVGDRDRVEQETIELLEEFDRRYVTPSRRRRERLLDQDEPTSDDLLTRALDRERTGERLFDDHSHLVREVALYVHGGSHTSAQTVCNVFYYLLDVDGGRPRRDWMARAARDPLEAQKCVHETLRLRPTTPEIKRVAEEDTVVAGQRIRAGERLVLDVRAANRDPALYGDAPDTFDPDRRIGDEAALWGLSFGAGPHICIGRSVAGGFPLTGATLRQGPGDAHLHGLVALMVQAFARRGVQLRPDAPPEPDGRTTRGTRWLRFPVRCADVGTSSRAR